MAETSNNITGLATIKNWFKTNFTPTQTQFWAVFDSFWHKSEKIPTSSINNFDSLFGQKADYEAFNAHLTNKNAHSDEFDKKVDKVLGKGLSSNDFTSTYKSILDNLPVSEAVSYVIGSGITANVSVNGDTIKGKITIEIKAIDSTILYALSTIKLLDVNFATPFNSSPVVLLTPASATYDYYVDSSTTGFKILTKSYDIVAKELFGIKSYPFTLSFYYNIIR